MQEKNAGKDDGQWFTSNNLKHWFDTTWLMVYLNLRSKFVHYLTISVLLLFFIYFFLCEGSWQKAKPSYL